MARFFLSNGIAQMVQCFVTLSTRTIWTLLEIAFSLVSKVQKNVAEEMTLCHFTVAVHTVEPVCYANNLSYMLHSYITKLHLFTQKAVQYMVKYMYVSFLSSSAFTGSNSVVSEVL